MYQELRSLGPQQGFALDPLGDSKRLPDPPAANSVNCNLNPLHGRYAFLRILGQYDNNISFLDILFGMLSVSD
jgi:hypothetical protein